MQIKLIFTTKISHLASFWKWNVLELGNGLLLVSFLHLLGTLRSNDAADNENVKKNNRLISKTTTSHVHRTFLFISFPFLHDYVVKMPDFAFYRGRKQATTKFYFSFWAWIWSLEIQFQEGSATFHKVSGQE